MSNPNDSDSFLPVSVASLDFPWDYLEWSSLGSGKSPRRHYSTLTLRDLAYLPDSLMPILAPQFSLFVWVTNTHTYEAFKIFRFWRRRYGIRYAAKAFTWAKLQTSSFEFNQQIIPGCMPPIEESVYWANNMGRYTMQNTEDCYILRQVKGNSLPRKSKAVHQLIVAPKSRRHSRKPDEFYRRVEELYGDVPRLEMFARPPFRPGWVVMGHEVDGKDIRVALNDYASGMRTQ